MSETSESVTVDPITMQVINSYLETTAREMGVAMMNTSYSLLFNEGLDFSCVVTDNAGEMIGQAEFNPAHLGAIPLIAEGTVDEIGVENFHPGDVVIHNDPFRYSCHLPEFAVTKPVFWEGELVAFLCNVGHMSEVGGKVPGGFPTDAVEVFQEGLRMPPVKIVERGEDRHDIWNIILSNVRTPRYSYGDLRAMIGSLHVGEERIHELIEKYGLETYRAVKEELKDYSERGMRAEIAELKDGLYHHEEYVADDDGITSEPARLVMSVIIEDDEIVVDYTGTDEQRKGPINCTLGVTTSATYNALLHLTSGDIPRNAGSFRPITIIAPKGSLVNVSYPGASVGGNTEIHPHLVTSFYQAVKEIIPERVPADDGGTSAILALGGVHPDTGERFVSLTNDGAGWGGRSFADGNSVTCIPNGNCAVQPIEVLETRYPLIHERFGLYEHSGGAGKYRGGLGSVRQIRVDCDELRTSLFMERLDHPPKGIFGGKSGKCSQALLKRADGDEFRTAPELFDVPCEGKFADVLLKKGDVVRMALAGGGGYGDPTERNVEAVERDLREGYISPEQAREDYGVVLNEDDETVDRTATRDLRAPGEGE